MRKLRLVFIPLALAAGLLVAAPTSTIPTASAAAFSINPSNCPDLLILGVRGSGQAWHGTGSTSAALDSAGPQVRAVVERFRNSATAKKSKKMIGYRPVNYPAVGSLGRSVPSKAYAKSVNAGRSAVFEAVISRHKKCGSRTKYLLIGYSQGGHVVTAVARTQGHRAVLDAHVVGVVSIADPIRHKRDGGTRFNFSADDRRFSNGALSGGGEAVAPASTATTPKSIRSRFVTVCAEKDGICNMKVPYSAKKIEEFSDAKVHRQHYQQAGPATVVVNETLRAVSRGGFRW